MLIALQSGEPAVAETHLQALVAAFPGQAVYLKRLATVLAQQRKYDGARACYQTLLERFPTDGSTHFQYARLLQRSGEPEAALEQYRLTLDNGVERPEDVHNNMGIIEGQLQRHDRARQAFQAALATDANYLPALFNLALLEEEHGRWPQASALFQRILRSEPRHPGALVRLAHGTRLTTTGDPLVSRIKRVLRSGQLRGSEREELLYALGKSHDDCADYAAAFDWYRQANTESQRRAGPYDAGAHERQVAALIAHCDRDWFGRIAPVSERPHVFICGMFRSGSTLVEQVLGAHPALTAGGELDYFQRHLPHWLLHPGQSGEDALSALALGYDEQLDEQFAPGARVINKRPDNFLLLGLLAALYPNARFIETHRHPLDNCISLYFQPFGLEQAYANALLDCGHYYAQYRRLMAHWQAVLGERLLPFGYEELLAQPEAQMCKLLDFLSLPWSAECLRFHAQGNRVRTASVHQVRQPLYSRAQGRWQHYQEALAPLQRYLDQAQLLPENAAARQ